MWWSANCIEPIPSYAELVPRLLPHQLCSQAAGTLNRACTSK